MASIRNAPNSTAPAGTSHHRPSQDSSGGSRSVMSKGPVTSWTSIKNMPKEISEYAIDYPATTDVKQKDMERHSIDEKLDSFQRALVCLKSDEPYEIVFVASKFDVFVKENMTRTFNEIFPPLSAELKTSLDLTLHQTAAQTMMHTCRNLYGKSVKQAKELLQLIFLHVDSEDCSISETWTQALNELMENLSPKELEKEFAPVIIEKAKNMSSLNARKAACILMKKLMSKASPELGTQLKALVRPLSQDPNPAIRGCICLQLPTIYHLTGSKDELLLNLSILAKDTDEKVKCCFISTISKIIKLPDMKFFFADSVPLIKRTVKEAYVTGNIELLQEFSSVMGEMAKILSEAGVLDANNKLWFLDAYLQLSRYGLPPPTGADMPTGFLNFRANTDYSRRHSLVESLIGTAPPKGTPAPGTNANSVAAAQGWICRMNAAKGFANFVKFAKPLVDFKAGLHPLIVDLIHDTNPKVRAAIAENIWPIMEMLGNAGSTLTGEFVFALSDDDLAVIEAIVPNISQILLALAQAKVISTENMSPTIVEIIGAIMFCEERLNSTTDWRTHSSLLSQLTVLPYVIPCDYIYTNIMPNLFHRLQHLRQLPCRLAASDAIISFLRNCRRANQREEIRRKIKESFAQGRSFQDRMLYLFMSKMIMDNFSRKYFRDHFFEQTLHMADDNVANVRLKFAGLMPDMKGTLKTADDDTLQKKLDEVLERIRKSETDRDVQNAIQEAVIEMKRMGVVMYEKAGGGSVSNKKAQKSREDAEDEAKEKEEAYIESLEKKFPDPKEIRDKKAEHFRPNVKPQPLPAAPPPPPKKVVAPPPPAPVPVAVPATTTTESAAPVPTLVDGNKTDLNSSVVEAQRLRRRSLVETKVALMNNKGGKK